MENQHRWILNADDVIRAEATILKGLKTFTVEDLVEKLNSSYLGEQSLTIQGIDCQVLVPGNPWRKGKIRLVVEFCPDEN